MKSVFSITEEMKRQFQSETAEHLNELEKRLMELERNPDNPDAIHSAFRCIHSIKGNSDYLGVGDINDLAHMVEDLMDDARGGRIALNPEVTDFFFQGLDLLKIMNRRIMDTEYRETDLSHMRGALDRIRQAASAPQNHETADHETADHETGSERDLAGVGVSDVLEQDIKVDIGRIDRFMEHMSEFAEARNALQHLARTTDAESGLSARTRGDIRAVSTAMKKVFDNFQTDLMALRLVRLNVLFDRLIRMTRDLSRRQGKLVELRVSGGEVSVDRKIMGGLVDPLVHLVRNAVDHGVELPEERRQAGKSETGVVTIRARQEGLHVTVAVSDDGRGLNPDRIRESALNSGHADAETLSAMSDADVFRLVFKAGFTTRKQADTVSGRGVGLDVVDTAVTAIGGSVSLTSGPSSEKRNGSDEQAGDKKAGDNSAGLRVSLRVPVSMTVTEVLIIRSGSEVSAIPFSGIRRIVRTERNRTRRYNGTGMFTWEGNLLLVRRLEKWLDPASEAETSTDAGMKVVVVKGERRTAGIEVDEVLGRDHVVIRPLGRFLTGLQAVSGAAVLGDGKVVMVVDPTRLGF